MEIENLEDWKRTHYSKDITPEMDNQEVIVMGWCRELRDMGKIKFIKLADREGFIQITAKKGDTSPKLIEKIEMLGREYVVAVKGTVRANKEAPEGREVIPIEIKVINIAEKPLPLELETKKTPADLTTRLNARVLDLRKPENLAVFKIQAKIIEGMQSFLNKNSFVQVFTPSLLGGSSEGGSDMFEVPYFGKKAYLRQDPQLHRELLIAAGFDKIYDLGPSWRAEESHTTHHLCEHRTCAPEISFIRNETDTIKLEEDLIVATLKHVIDMCQEELKTLKIDLALPKQPFPELRFPEIYDILKDMKVKIMVGEDLTREAEESLAEYVGDKHGSEFFFINRFPFKVKPFYVMRVDEDPRWARSVDFIYKGLELSSGGQREHRYDEIMKNIKEKKLKAENFKWFTDFFKYGVPPMGGFSIGIERFTMKLLNLSNIKEAVLFARDPERLLP
jgi:aspartyl-tRNA synthetase